MAKSCVDNYMKQKLLTLIENYAHVLHGLHYKTWYSGRFLDEWAEAWIVQKLTKCYSHYDKTDIEMALVSTMELFREIVMETAIKMNYEYPIKADVYAANWVTDALNGYANKEGR